MSKHLKDLNADAFAEAVANKILNLVHFLLSILEVPPRPITPGGTFTEQVRALCQFAQEGGPSNDIPEILDEVIQAFYATPHLEDDTSAVEKLMQVLAREPETDFEIVVQASMARYGIERGKAVPLTWVAALGSVSTKSLRNLASGDEIRTG
ncbi:MAG TPA: hypothetical protein VHO25_08710, partial [Polyangiaceae bacterium]|nr:hypothetical protein [Polyangiaceae bacterium]